MAVRARRPDRIPLPRRPGPLRRLVMALLPVASAALCVPMAALPAAQAQAQDAASLDGGFVGIGAATGMSLSFEGGGDAPSGRFVDSNGAESAIGGGWVDGGLETVLAFPGRPVFARFVPVPLGVQMTVLPFDAEGRPLEGEARVLAFLREGTPTPVQPNLYMQPPRRADGESDPDVFLASYQFWPPEGVYNGFSQIGARYRTMIRFFPQIHADVLWKLCDADGAGARALVAEALRGQGADCSAVSGTLERLQETGRFFDWKRAVNAEIEAMLPAVQCARGYVVRESVCAPASARIAEAAVSLETVGSLLDGWR